MINNKWVLGRPWPACGYNQGGGGKERHGGYHTGGDSDL